MNILIFNWRDLKHIWAGGGEICIFEQALRWNRAGHHVVVFSGQNPDNDLPEHETYNGIQVYRKGSRYSLYFWAIWYYFRSFRKKTDVVIDVVNGIPFFTPLFVNKPIIAYVHHFHGKQFRYEIPPLLAEIGMIIERFIFPIIYNNTPIIAVSKITRDLLIRHGFKHSNISIVYNGIQSSQKIIYKDKFKYPTILYLGRIKRYKRVDLLIDIFPEIIKHIPQARLVIAGWGTEASNIANLVMKSPFRKKITLAGPVTTSEKNKLLSKSWVFVNLSIGEGWGISVMEANLHGTPAVAFKVPGLSESIIDQKTGLLANNKEDLIKKLVELLSNTKLRQTLSSNARKRAREFDWDKTSSKSLEIITKQVNLFYPAK